jgi:RNA polymerase sigma factor (sigma-70 family)
MSATLPPPTAAAVRRPRRSLRFTRDDELVRLTRAGDSGAFEALYDRHARGILSFCRHMLGSKEEAEDAVQHTFLAAHRDLVSSEKPIQLKAWLYTIARNRCLSILRSRKEERALEDVPEPSVEGLASQVQQRQDLQEMLVDLRRLPDDQRAALVLSELGDLTHEEIGQTLGVRKDKVKALVFQARESLASSRTARDADCAEIQEQLAVLRGGALRRTQLRRHVEVCPACASFKAEVHRQRAALGVLLPVAPSLALKEAVIAGTVAAGGGGMIGGGGAAAGGGRRAAATGGGKALIAKVATLAVVAGTATGGGLKAVDEISGGDGGTATAQAGVPPEQRSVELVGALRKHADVTAAKRAADHGKAHASAPARERDRDSGAVTRPAVARPGEGERITVAERGRETIRAGEAKRKGPKRERIVQERKRSESQNTPAAQPPAAPQPPAPAPAQPTPPAQSPPAADVDVDEGTTQANAKGGKGKWWKGKGKGHRHHQGKHRQDPPAVPAPAPAPPAPAPAPEPPKADKPKHKDRGRSPWPGRRGRGREEQPPAPQPTPAPAPAPPPPPPPPPGKGHGRPGGDGEGHHGKGRVANLVESLVPKR